MHQPPKPRSPLSPRHTLLSATPAVLAFALVACGGGSSGSSNSPPATEDPVNAIPTANNVTVIDSNGEDALVGDELAGSYLYDDADGDGEAASSIQWQRNETLIDGATEINYTLVQADSGQSIRMTVTPIAATGESPGNTVTSNTVTVVNSAPTASNASISSSYADENIVILDQLTAQFDFYDADGDTQATPTYQWFRNDTPIESATQVNYTLTPADGSQSIRFEVTPYASTGILGGIAASSAPVTPRFPEYGIFQAAEVVIGQADFTSNAHNQGGTVGANTASFPFGNPAVNNGTLYLTDTYNHRLLGFNALPSDPNTDADFVLGQVDFSSNSPGTSSLAFDTPYTTTFGDGKMFLTSYETHRVLIWDTIPKNGQIPANHVLGQSDFDSKGHGDCNATGLSYPESIWAVKGKLIVTDSFHNRVLIWNTIPSENNTQANLVLGQQSFDHCAANDQNDNGTKDAPTNKTLNSPTGVWSDGQRLVILDSDNNRILIWNTFPTPEFPEADIVLGQNDFDHNHANDDDGGGDGDNHQDGFENDTPTSRTLNRPSRGVFSNGTQLFVTDTDNNRILIWNSFPTENFQAADVVLGQPDFNSQLPNNDPQEGTADSTPSKKTLWEPSGILQVGLDLIVTDTENNRYLIYKGK